MRAVAVSLLLIAAVAGEASAQEGKPIVWLEGDGSDLTQDPLEGGDVANVLYLNRCDGDCTITASASNNSLGNQTWFGDGPGPYTLSEFGHDQATWDAIKACVQDVYAPYGIIVTDVDPSPASHTEVFVAGLGEEIGRGDAGGLGGGKSSTSSNDCQAVNNNVAFAFANGYPASAVEYICGVIGQEASHSWGISDHIRDCRDPMSYSYFGPCGNGERGYFRDRLMQCANVGSTLCTCGGARVNTHQHLSNIFGEADPGYPPTTVEILQPADGEVIADTASFVASGTAHRGIYRVEVLLNGWLWGVYESPEGLAPGSDWPIPAMVVPVEDGFPDGVIDVEFRAYDDIGTMGTATIQVMKGAACTDASSCLDGQQCADGKCFWEPPTGQLGDACTFDQECVGPNVYDGRCEAGDDGTQICTRECFGAPNDDCEAGFECLVTNTNQNSGVCWPATAEEPGCCSTGGGGSAPWGAIVIVALLLRRRRR